MEKNLPVRKPNRLINFDYSTEGAYFITICTHQRRKILSRVGEATCLPQEKACPLQLTELGKVVKDAKDYNEIADYIEANPLNWEKDCFFNEGDKGEK